MHTRLPVLSTHGERSQYSVKMTNGGEMYHQVLSTRTYSDFHTKLTTLSYTFQKKEKWH